MATVRATKLYIPVPKFGTLKLMTADGVSVVHMTFVILDHSQNSKVGRYLT